LVSSQSTSGQQCLFRGTDDIRESGETPRGTDALPSFGHEGFVSAQVTAVRPDALKTPADLTFGEVEKKFWRLTQMGGVGPRGTPYRIRRR
jgi:hypothetical protein